MKFLKINGFMVVNLLTITVSIVTFVYSETVQGVQQFCTIETESGRVRGKQNSTLFENKLFYSFQGIPFAKPPINDLRFKAPEKNNPWNGTFDAFDYGDDCIQPVSEHNEYAIGSEDCLHLNVFVPRECDAINATTKLPVLFYIFGGRFIFGSARHYAPDFFMEKNVIVVTINYRLGPFGFLSLGSREYSGNMAMKDQILALKWVNDNIDRFGGDKDKITLMGHSCGGVSIELLMISTQSKHLFQKAIMISGSALDPWIPTRMEHSSIVYDLDKDIGQPVSNQSELIEFLKKVDDKVLLSRTFRPEYMAGVGRRVFDLVWTVCVEDPTSIDPFLTESPFDILTNENYTNTIDALYSYSPKELMPYREQLHPERLKEFDEVFEMNLPLEIAQMDFDSELYKNISHKIRSFYFDGKRLNAGSLKNMSMLISDIVFLYGIDLSARIHAAKSTGRTFVTQYSVENEWNYSVKRSKPSNYTIKYSQHFDQLYYLFRLSMDPSLVSDEDYQGLRENSLQRNLIKETVHFYANFVKFSNPISSSEFAEFKANKTSQFQYFDIKNDGIFLKNSIRNRTKFWDGIFEENKQHWNTSFNFHFD